MRMVIWPEAGERCLSCRAASIHLKWVQQSWSRHSPLATQYAARLCLLKRTADSQRAADILKSAKSTFYCRFASCFTLVRTTKAHPFYRWNQEGQGLAGSCLSLADDVYARQAHREGSRLDVGAGLVAEYLCQGPACKQHATCGTIRQPISSREPCLKMERPWEGKRSTRAHPPSKMEQ